MASTVSIVPERFGRIISLRGLTQDRAYERTKAECEECQLGSFAEGTFRNFLHSKVLHTGRRTYVEALCRVLCIPPEIVDDDYQHTLSGKGVPWPDNLKNEYELDRYVDAVKSSLAASDTADTHLAAPAEKRISDLPEEAQRAGAVAGEAHSNPLIGSKMPLIITLAILMVIALRSSWETPPERHVQVMSQTSIPGGSRAADKDGGLSGFLGKDTSPVADIGPKLMELFSGRARPFPPPPGPNHIAGFFQEPISTGEGLKAESLLEAWVMAYLEKHQGSYEYRGLPLYQYGDRDKKRDAIIRKVKEEGAEVLLEQIAPAMRLSDILGNDAFPIPSFKREMKALFSGRRTPAPPPPDGPYHIAGFLEEPISTGEGLKAETPLEAWVMAYLEKHPEDYLYRGLPLSQYGDRNKKRDAIIRKVKEEGADTLLEQIAPRK